MKNTEIPRYKASMPLQTVYITNADKCGDHVFTQVARKNNVAVYRRNMVDTGKLAGFETIIIKTVKAGTTFAKGAKPVESDYESYPGAESFGRSAWSFPDEKIAMARFNELTTEQPAVVDDDTAEQTPVAVARVAKGEVTLKIPDHPFTQKNLAETNGFFGNDYKKVYSDLQNMLKNGIIKVVGEKQSGRGKAAKLFQKV